MDYRARVYYLTNLNQNYNRGGWWSKGWDDYGRVYRENIRKIKSAVTSLKITPNNQTKSKLRNGRYVDYYQMKLSCKKEEERLLIETLDELRDANYIKLNDLTGMTMTIVLIRVR